MRKYIYGTLFSYKKNYIFAICSNMDGPSIMLNEINKAAKKKKNTIWFHLHVGSKKKKKEKRTNKT